MPRLNLQDYINLGQEKNLDFIGQINDQSVLNRLAVEVQYYVCGGIPLYAVDATYWRCRLVGKVMNKAIAAVRYREYGSRYQRTFSATYAKYRELARILGITFIYDPKIEFFPVTTKTPCRWMNRSDQLVVASYHDLGYDMITSKRQEQLGIKIVTSEARYGY